LHVDQRTFPQVLAHDLGQVALADVPGHAVVVVGELAPVAVRSACVAVGRDAERGHRLPAGCVTHLRVAGEPSDQHHLVEAHSSFPSSASTASTASSTSSTSSTAVAGAA